MILTLAKNFMDLYRKVVLTKDDLSKIRKVIREEVEAESTNSRVEIQGELKLMRIKLENRIGELEDRNKNLEIEIHRGLALLQKSIRELKKDIKVVISWFDSQGDKLTKRIERVEGHLGLSPTSL